MRRSFLVLLFLCFLSTLTVVKAQQNSPWKKFTEENSNGVILVPGCHEHSLTNGQGYSVYLKNTNNYPVTVSGSLIAKTTCGGEVNTNFKVYLQPGESAPGSDFFLGSKTGQTSVVTAQTCSGNRYNPSPSYLNRISNVRLWNVDVNPKSTITNEIKVATPQAPVYVAPTSVAKYDSTAYWRNSYIVSTDSLNNQIFLLKNRNSILIDSLDYYRRFGTKPSLPVTPLSNYTLPKPSNGLKPFELLLNAGIGVDNLPLLINNDSALNPLLFKGSTYTGSSTHPLLHLGLVAKLFNNAPVNLELNPFLSYGLNLANGSGNHLTYGIGANVLATLSKNLPLKLLGLVNYTGRSGDWTKTPETADYNYNFLKYGGGLRYALNENTWIQPTISFDKLNTAGATAATVFGIESMINNKFGINVNYSSKYINSGPIKYLISNFEDKGFLSLRLLYNLGLIK